MLTFSYTKLFPGKTVKIYDTDQWMRSKCISELVTTYTLGKIILRSIKELGLLVLN